MRHLSRCSDSRSVSAPPFVLCRQGIRLHRITWARCRCRLSACVYLGSSLVCDDDAVRAWALVMHLWLALYQAALRHSQSSAACISLEHCSNCSIAARDLRTMPPEGVSRWSHGRSCMQTSGPDEAEARPQTPVHAAPTDPILPGPSEQHNDDTAHSPALDREAEPAAPQQRRSLPQTVALRYDKFLDRIMPEEEVRLSMHLTGANTYKSRCVCALDDCHSLPHLCSAQCRAQTLLCFSQVAKVCPPRTIGTCRRWDRNALFCAGRCKGLVLDDWLESRICVLVGVLVQSLHAPVLRSRLPHHRGHHGASPLIVGCAWPARRGACT